MTDRYPLDPRDEIRPCELVRRDNPCPEHGPDCLGYIARREPGRHRLLPADDQRLIEVREISAYRWQWKLMSDIDWNYRNRGTTRDAALLAARCAVWGVEVHKLYDFYYTSQTGAELALDAEGLPTPEAALCAAIDAAMKEKP